MRLLVIGVVCLASSAIAQTSENESRRNPFVHPKFDTEAFVASPGETLVREEPIRVTAILLAGERSLVSVDGVVLGIGEEHEGYVLREVHDESAIFSHRGKSVTVTLFDERSADNGG